jgi:hypothetical protein
MQVRFLLLFLLVMFSSTIGWGQLFQNRNLYDIWITADQYVDAGKFDDAIKLYEAAPQVPEFTRQLTLTRRIQTIFQTGERLYRTKKYAEALETFSRYRDIAPDLHVAILDDRIQACLYQLEKVVVKKLAESTRVVAGFEYAYKGEKKLMELDTLAALNYFTKARKLGAGLNPTLREQYLEGLKSVKALRNWGNEYRQTLATQDKARMLDVLRTYRSASKYIINALEYELKNAEEGASAMVSTSASVNPGERMQQYALDCRIEDLIYFVQSNSGSIAQASLISRSLINYRSIEEDITTLRKAAVHGSFLESAYQNLIVKAREVPEIGEIVQVCAKRKYFEYLVGKAQKSEQLGRETGDKNQYREALRYVMEAYQLGFAQDTPPLDELQRRSAALLDCEDRQRDFAQQLTAVRSALAQCQVKAAKLAWDRAAARLASCGLDEDQFATSYVVLRDSVVDLFTADSLLPVLVAQQNKALIARQCEEARMIMQRIAKLTLCNPAIRDSQLVEYGERLKQCEQITCYTTARSKAFQSAENREWRKSYDYYQQAYACASESQKGKIQEIMNDMECDAYPERCRGSHVSFSLEPSGRVVVNKPKYTEDGVGRETTYGYLASAGLQLSFLSYLYPLDVVLGLEYFQTEYQFLEKGYAAGDFKITGADAYVAFKLHQPGTDPNRLRPYLKGGFDVLLPMSYSLRNHYKVESTRDRSLLKKQSLGALAGMGVEMQKPKFGFFLEIIGGYNFSGIYNANAVSSSGARGKTESQFRTIGIRMGVRLW